MLKVTRAIQNYLLIGLPFLIACMIWGTMETEKEILMGGMLQRGAWEVLSWNLMLWFTVAIAFLFLLVFHPTSREMTLKRLANIKERDEREEFITGKASRNAYISTLNLLLLLLFISILSVDVYRVPEADAINGKRGRVTIGLSFNLLDEPKIKKDENHEVLFESKSLPLSKSAIILILIAWQIVVFSATARKENLSE